MKIMTLFNKKHIQDNSGFALIELAMVMTIVGILAAIAIPQYGSYKVRAYDSMSQSDINHVYYSCRAYWQEQPEGSLCTIAQVTSANYGFVQSKGVVLTIVDGTKANFLATSSHAGSSITYQIGPVGYATIQ
jgi:prepilin-type N-terminal cleavage/methylation domain-containing protein